MKTKQVPAMIMLIAGLVVSIVAVITHMETMQFLKILVIVLIVFYIAGCVVKVILDNKSTYVVAWMVQHKQTFS